MRGLVLIAAVLAGGCVDAVIVDCDRSPAHPVCRADAGAPSDDAGCAGSRTVHRDFDGDGFGDRDDTMSIACALPPPDGYTPVPGDCNDRDRTVHPDAPERCGDRIDDDCNGARDEGCSEPCNDRDDDGDGFVDEDLVARATTAIGTSEGRADLLAVGWDASRARAAIVWGSREGADTVIRFAVVDASGIRVGDESTVHRLEGMWDLGVGWDGSAWAIFWIESRTSSIQMLRVDDDGSSAAGPSELRSEGSTPHHSLSVAQGPDSVAIAHTAGDDGEVWGGIVIGGVVAGPFLLFAGGAPLSVGDPALTHVADRRYAAFVPSSLDRGVAFVTFDTGRAELPIPYLNGGVEELPRSAAWSPSMLQFLLVWFDRTTTEGRYVRLFEDGSPVGPSLPTEALWVAADWSSYYLASSGAATMRLRASDGVPYRTVASPAQPFAAMVGLGRVTERFLGVLATPDGTVHTQVIACP